MSTFAIAAAAVGLASLGMNIAKGIGANKRRRQAMKANEKARAKLERDKEKYIKLLVNYIECFLYYQLELHGK